VPNFVSSRSLYNTDLLQHLIFTGEQLDNSCIVLPDCNIQNSANHLVFHLAVENLALKLVTFIVESPDTDDIVVTKSLDEEGLSPGQEDLSLCQENLILTNKQFGDGSLAVNTSYFLFGDIFPRFYTTHPMSTFAIAHSQISSVGGHISHVQGNQSDITYNNTVIINIPGGHCFLCHLTSGCKKLWARACRLLSVSV
jgi:hypothetical protein